jgi:hypothetical protein
MFRNVKGRRSCTPSAYSPRCFRPTEEFRVLRSYLRQCENLVAGIGICMQTIPKALPEMNRQRTNVLPDIRGKSAMAILRAIVAGERDPYPRAELCASRVHSTRQPVRKVWKAADGMAVRGATESLPLESGVCAKAKAPNEGSMYLPEAERWQRNCRVS